MKALLADGAMFGCAGSTGWAAAWLQFATSRHVGKSSEKAIKIM